MTEVSVAIATTAHIVVCFFLIIVVLLQQGKGADAGATFGGGGGTVFGASGADNLLSRLTKIAAALFMITSIFLAAHAKHSVANEGMLLQNPPVADQGKSTLQESPPQAETSGQKAEPATPAVLPDSTNEQPK